MSRKLDRILVALCLLAGFASTSITGVIVVHSLERHGQTTPAARAAERSEQPTRRAPRTPPPERVGQLAALDLLDALGVKPSAGAGNTGALASR